MGTFLLAEVRRVDRITYNYSMRTKRHLGMLCRCIWCHIYIMFRIFIWRRKKKPTEKIYENLKLLSLNHTQHIHILNLVSSYRLYKLFNVMCVCMYHFYFYYSCIKKRPSGRDESLAQPYKGRKLFSEMKKKGCEKIVQLLGMVSKGLAFFFFIFFFLFLLSLLFYNKHLNKLMKQSSAVISIGTCRFE